MVHCLVGAVGIEPTQPEAPVLQTGGLTTCPIRPMFGIPEWT